MVKQILFVLFCGFVFSSNASVTFEEGISLFNKKEFVKSAAKFDSIIQVNPNDIGALYNLGVAKMKCKKWGEAIWAFEKALIFTPNDIDSKNMIEECHYEIDPGFLWEYRLNVTQSTLYSISSKIWATIAILFSFVIASIIVLYRKSINSSSKRILGILGIMSVLIFIFTLVTGHFTKQHKTENNFAIVTEKSVVSLHEKVTITEGTLLEIVNSTLEDSEVRVETEEGELLSFEPNQMSFL